ncbi:MAG TPA: hypothetical protein VN726_06375, partial [Hanamia sp.]|nr:hypothetical protein [Hanamia sp.]
MLIDTSYFEAELSMGQITSPAVVASVNLFIEKYEEDLLTTLLGYPLYKAFMLGLADDPIDQKWVDLLNGAEYTYNGRLRKWGGILQVPNLNTSVINGADPVSITVGGAGDYDPVAESTTATIPAAMVGRNFTLIQRAYGPLKKGIEYSVSGNVLTLLNGLKFSQNDTYFYFGNGELVGVSPGTNKRSPIANYVYWHYLKDNVSFTMGSGEVKPKEDVSVSPRLKMVRAWNEMVYMNRE